MAQMTKIALALPEQMIRALAVVEQDTDRPRTRVIRRAVSDYLRDYAKAHPDFVERVGVPLVEEKEFRPGLQTDIVVIRGVKHTVVVTESGWRQVTPEDYVVVDNNLLSILDKDGD